MRIFINVFKPGLDKIPMALHYAKGSRAERELIEIFSSNGFSVIRAAGSGVSSLCPDILVFKRGMQYAIEAKAWETEHLHLDKDQFLGLKKWEENTGITTYVGWRRNRKDWIFIPPSIFEEREKSFTLSWKRAEGIGRKLSEFL
jgi:Holliday junction resolvase